MRWGVAGYLLIVLIANIYYGWFGEGAGIGFDPIMAGINKIAAFITGTFFLAMILLPSRKKV